MSDTVIVFPIVVPISFDDILPIWTNSLWPGRKSPIRRVSTMVLFGGYDMTIRQSYDSQAKFFGVRNQTGDLIGVFSGHPTSTVHYRARGLWVDPNFQNLGVGRALVQSVVNAAAASGRVICWCLPRVVNVPFFLRSGFVQLSQPFTEGVEFGPNVYMSFQVSPL